MKNDIREQSPIFNTSKRIRLGIWGLGRGMNFYATCKALNIDVVAGCDFNEHMRTGFLQQNPGAFATADAEEFLNYHMDAVLLATFCPAHGPDAIRCLKAGKHVLSEVTSFFTMAEGVQLVEEVEKRKLVYNLAENYPFTPDNRYLARKWQEGLFGELMYAEYEYVHECRSLCYTYIDGVPIQPGHTVHNWRSWINFHYYCTHSLGPVMVITGTRPTRVVSLPCDQHLAGYLVRDRKGMGGATPSLINMNNGGIVRNLMGATTSDSHIQRIWGTFGASEWTPYRGLQLRLGGTGGSPLFQVKPSLDKLGQLAANTGHGGGDFWVLYYFAREILTGEPGPFNIYSAADVTIPGLLAYRSSMEDGRPLDVPDFRKKSERDKYRNDHYGQERYDVINGVFPAKADKKVTGNFTTVMANLIRTSAQYRAFADWAKVLDDVTVPEKVVEMGQKIVADYPEIKAAYKAARRIVDAYPTSDGAKVLLEMLELGQEKIVMAPGFLATLKRKLAPLAKKYHLDAVPLTAAKACQLIEAPTAIASAKPPRKGLAFNPIEYNARYEFLDIRPLHSGTRDGLVYLKGNVRLARGGKGLLLYGADGPTKVWVNGKAVDCQPAATNPAVKDQYRVAVTWRKGSNEILAAMRTNHGKAWGFIARAAVE